MWQLTMARRWENWHTGRLAAAWSKHFNLQPNIATLHCDKPSASLTGAYYTNQRKLLFVRTGAQTLAVQAELTGPASPW